MDIAFFTLLRFASHSLGTLAWLSSESKIFFVTIARASIVNFAVPPKSGSSTRDGMMKTLLSLT
jgi:hypothetical protein